MRFVGVSLVAVLALATAIPAAEPTESDLLTAIEKRLKVASERVGPSVACVVVSRSDRYPKPSDNDQPGKLGGYDKTEFLKAHPNRAKLAVTLDLSDPLNIADHGYACGVVLDATGLILTPYHVVEGATKIYVHLPNSVGSYADIHAADARHDLAVLKLLNPPARLSPVKFGEVRLREQGGKPANVERGAITILVANNFVPNSPPDKPSAALGSVKGVRYPRTAEGEKYSSYYHYGPLIEHDAKSNVGVDGAALLNLDGELIGLATSAGALGGERGPFQAFPADHNFRRVVEVLRRGEEVEYGFLGVSLPSNQHTTQITGVTPRGPADLAGVQGNLQPNLADFITHIGDVPIGTYEDLLTQVAALAGQRVKLTVSRGLGGNSRVVTATLGKFKNPQPFIASTRPEPVFGLRVDYSSILAQPLDPRGVGGTPPGVCVREVAPDSPAANAFKKLPGAPGKWIITRVNGTDVTTPAEFYKAAMGQKSVRLTVQDSTEISPRDREVTLP